MQSCGQEHLRQVLGQKECQKWYGCIEAMRRKRAIRTLERFISQSAMLKIRVLRVKSRHIESKVSLMCATVSMRCVLAAVAL